MVVVLPVPFTPTTSTTCGRFAGSSRSGCATGARIAAISSASACLISSSVTSLPKRDAAEARDHPPRHLGAEVGGDQHVLQLLQRRIVQPPLLEDAR